jgi:DNA repair protein RadD
MRINPMQLRPYQQAAVNAVYNHLRDRDDNPCVVIPTAGGKTPCMATICKDAVTLWQGRVLVLAHVKELLQQTADKLTAVCPEVDYGIYSAGLKRRDTDNPVIIAGIQSVYKRACELDRFDLIIVDEAHLISPDGEGMYQQFLAESKMVNPRVRIIGFTATPFRLKDGPICAPENILNTICYEVGIKELIRDGFLCPLVSKSGKDQIDFGSLHIRAGEFVADEVEALMDSESLVESVCREIVEQTADRNAVLIFSSGVRHGNHIVETLDEKYGIECGFVTGETPPKIRDILLKQFRRGDLKYLCNVNVLTTGFDAPNIDCVAMVRPTSSPGLFYQAVGRGFRLHPSKQNCLVLDFGGNVLRHGPVDALRLKPGGNQGTGDAPAKKCPHCNALIAMGYANCPECGFEFPPPEKQNHEAQATQAPILSGQVTNTRYEVTDTHYYSHLKRGAADDAPRSMRVDYMVGWRSHKSEWICFEHSGYARQRAVAWWKQRSRDPVPETTDEALARIEGGAIAQTLAIQVRSVSGEEYERIIDYELGPLPEPLEPQHFSNAFSDEEIPF